MPKHSRLIAALGALFVLLLLVGNQRTAAQTADWEPESCPAPSWAGAFYTNASLSGEPARTACRRILHFNWGGGAPFTEIPADNWSTRWTTKQTLSYAGTYQFRVASSNGIRVLIDGVPAIDAINNATPNVFTFDYNADCDGKVINLTLEFAHTTGNALLQFEYALKSGGSAGAAADHILGTDQGGGNVWKVEHFENPGVQGTPVALDLHYADGISYNYRLDPASAGMNPDQWSSRWTRTVDFPAGTYNFYLRADDEATLFIDGTAVLTQSVAGKGQTSTHTQQLGAGRHTLMVYHTDHADEASLFLTWDPPVGTMLFPDSCNAIETANVNGGGALCPDRGVAAATGQCIALSTPAIGPVQMTPLPVDTGSTPVTPATAALTTPANTTTTGTSTTAGISAATIPTVALPATVKAGPLYFRPLPNRTSGNIAMLHQHEQYVALGRSADNVWIQLEVGEILGWSMSEYLTISGDINTLPVTDGTQPITTTPSNVPPVTGIYSPSTYGGTTGPLSSAVGTGPTISSTLPKVSALATGNMKIRSGPGATFDRIGGISWGATVKVTGRSSDGKWIQIISGNLQGWSSADWFTIVEGNLNDLPVIN